MQIPPSVPHKVRSRRLLVRLVCLLTVLILGVLWKIAFRSGFPGDARPVLSTAHWTDRNLRYSPNPPYSWLPNGDLAYMEANGTGKLQIYYQMMDANGPVGAARLGAELAKGSIGDFFFTPCPDEQWIACLQNSGNAILGTTLVSADGMTKRTLPDIFMAWLPDSRSLLVNSSTAPYGMKVVHIDTNRAELLPPTIEADTLVPGLLSINSPNFLIGGRFSRTTSYLAAPLKMTLRSFRVAQPDVVQDQWQVALPEGMDSASASASPDSKHLSFIYNGQFYLVPVD